MAHGQIVGQFSVARSSKLARKQPTCCPDTRPRRRLRGEVFTFGLTWGNVMLRLSILTMIPLTKRNGLICRATISIQFE
jgi:hypothetical protein